MLREAPQTLFPKLFKAWRVTHLVFEKDTDSYARERDRIVAKAARDAGVEVLVRSGRTLWDSDRIVQEHGGKPTMTISQLQAAGKKIGDISKPIPAADHLPDPGEMPIDFDHKETEPNPNSEHRSDSDSTYSKIAGPRGDFAIETMLELGFPPASTPHRGGESVALQKLQKILEDKKFTATFEKPKTSPAQYMPQSTTLLSPYLHFGALSARLFYWRVEEEVRKYGKGASSPPTSLTGQLLFRDMYFAAQAAVGPFFAQTVGNPYCRFVPWHLPSKRDDPSTGLVTGGYTVDSQEAETWFQRWRFGVTGFPWIDALMRQLKQEGWIHHLGRHSVACFLTRGGCYIDWERGAEVFEEWLLDHEPACNAGNWQWLSCTAFFSQYYRCYSPIAFGQKWDKQGDFIRRWVPELAKMDARYIYEPWKAPELELKRAGVRVTGDGLSKQDGTTSTYPRPMFDFSHRRDVCISAMKTAFDIGLHGDDSQVLDGTWTTLFPSEQALDDHGDFGGVDDEGIGKGASKGAVGKRVAKTTTSETVKKRRK